MSENINETSSYEVLPVEGIVSLRQLRLDEAQVIFDVVDRNRDYLSEWLPWAEHTNTVIDSEKFIEDIIRKRKAGSEYGFAIIVDGKPSGHTSLMHLTDGGTPEIGYWVDGALSGQGITSKAAKAMTEFGLKTLGLPKIVIKAQPGNIASNKIAEKLGYTLEPTTEMSAEGHVLNIWTISKEVI